jgi:phospholipase/lecithinase/hemolysin
MRQVRIKIRRSGRILRLGFAALTAVALTLTPPCFAVTFSQMFVFGDSTVDAGYYRALSSPGANGTYTAYWPSAVANGAGVPTSSPGLMYSQVLAARFGLTANPSNQPGGTNYATSGAKNVDVNTSTNGGFQAAIPTATQIANYLAAKGNRADGNALYLISSGGNEITYASAQSGAGPYPADPAAYLTSRAGSLARAIASLASAGAKHILVANLPASFPLNNTAQQQLKAGYNTALFASLANQGVAVTMADINSVRLAIQGNPSAYGFTSTGNAIGQTACSVPAGITTAWGLLCSSNPNSPSTFVSSNADMTRLFADDQHLATAGQKIIADYIYNLLQTIPAGLGSTDNVTGLWWNPAESGWGINFNHQGSVVFATLFTYDLAGKPLWLVMSNGVRQADGNTFTGDLYQTTGPAFNAVPFTPIGAANITKVGTMSLAFSSLSAASLNYSVNGVAVIKSIQPQVFGTRAATCQPTQASRNTLTNYQDLWWNDAESGWGVNVTHQDNTLFATLFTYDASGKEMWLVMSAGARQTDGSYLGDLYQTTGPAFNAQPFTPIAAENVTKVGSMQFRFSDGTHGTLTYSVNGVSVSKSIVRQEFATPLAACVP